MGSRATGQHMSITTSIVALLVALFIIKPWGEAAPPPVGVPPVSRATTGSPTPAPTRDRTAEGLAEPLCVGAGAWSLASVEAWRTQDVRVWRAIVPITTASGPLDPAIPSVLVAAIELSALGFCAPSWGPDKPDGPATVTAWLVRDGIAGQLLLHQIVPADGVTPLAALYAPLPGCAGVASCPPFMPRTVPTPWIGGQVVFRYVDEGTQEEAWFAADIRIVPPLINGAPSAGA